MQRFVDLSEVEAILDEGHARHLEARRAQGHIQELAHGGLRWRRDPRKPPDAQRRAEQYRRLASRLLSAALRPPAVSIDAVDEAINQARRRLDGIKADLKGLEGWKAYDRPPVTPQPGRPDGEITECAARLRKLLPRKSARVPLWDLVAKLIRFGFPSEQYLDADALKDRVRQYRRRRTG